MPESTVSQNIFVSPGRTRPSPSDQQKPVEVLQSKRIEHPTLQEKIVHPKPVSKSNIELIRAELSDINPDEHIIWIK